MLSDKQPSTKKRVQHVDPLAVTASLGFQTFRRESRKPWTKEEDLQLQRLMLEMYGTDTSELDPETVKWDVIAQRMEAAGRKPKDCRKRWSNSLDPNLRKGKWTKEEDERLVQAYGKWGPAWQKVSAEITGRTDDQCAKRYIEVLDPSIKDRLKPWSREEDVRLIRQVKMHGTKWRTISGDFNGRTSLTCRNRWRKLVTEVVRGNADEVIKQEVDNVTNGNANLVPASAAKHIKAEPAPVPAPVAPTPQRLPQHHQKHTKPVTSTTEWKYSLDSKSSNVFDDAPHKKFFADNQGAVSSQELVQYLVQYAKENGVDITVHQHVHHHYSPRENSPSQMSFPGQYDFQEDNNRKLSALLEPETQLSRYQHFNYLSPLTEVPKLTSSSSPPLSQKSKDSKEDLLSAFVQNNVSFPDKDSTRLTPLTQAVEMAAAAETRPETQPLASTSSAAQQVVEPTSQQFKTVPTEEEEEIDFWESMKGMNMSYNMAAPVEKEKPVSQHHPLHYDQPSLNNTTGSVPSGKRRRQDDEKSTTSERVPDEDVDADILNSYGLFYNIYTKEGSVIPDAPDPKKPKRSIYDQWGGFGIIPFNPS
ncbi:hypothetical protein DICA3_F03532 [Diutina catenulata]